MKLFVLVSFLFVAATTAFGQQPGVAAELGYFGAMRPSATDLPVPVYPDAALKANLGGRVSVAVTIDQNGNVLSADDPTGPYPVCGTVTDQKVLEMRAVAIEAARAARFAPVAPDQKGTVVTGRIVYIFTPEQAPEEPVISGIKASVGGTDAKEMSLSTGAEIAVADKTTMAAGADNKMVQKIPIATARPKTVSGGVLNAAASSLAIPVYPASAKAVHASGAVAVHVLIDEDGRMYSAEAISGHPLLRGASEIAACGSRFPPTLLSGQPVRVSGVITYNFVP